MTKLIILCQFIKLLSANDITANRNYRGASLC